MGEVLNSTSNSRVFTNEVFQYMNSFEFASRTESKSIRNPSRFKELRERTQARKERFKRENYLLTADEENINEKKRLLGALIYTSHY